MYEWDKISKMSVFDEGEPGETLLIDVNLFNRGKRSTWGNYDDVSNLAAGFNTDTFQGIILRNYEYRI